MHNWSDIEKVAAMAFMSAMAVAICALIF